MATCLAGNNQLNIGVVGFALMQSIWQHEGYLVQKNNTCVIPPKKVYDTIRDAILTCARKPT